MPVCLQRLLYTIKYISRKVHNQGDGRLYWMESFAGLAMIGRNQGVAVIINIFLGTIANAAYGVANQINGALGHFSATFQKAINPQLMKSEGMNDRNRLFVYHLSHQSSLYLLLRSLPFLSSWRWTKF